MPKKTFPHYLQPDSKDCGPTCLRIIAKYYGKSLSLQNIRQLSETTREGSSLMGLSEAAENMGFVCLYYFLPNIFSNNWFCCSNKTEILD
jgi:ATP-binding cassette, subfamily B, bacterial